MVDGPAQALAEHLALAGRVEELLPRVDEIARRLIDIYTGGGRVFTLGNGGSAADAQHLAAELVGRYVRDRRPLPASALSVDPSVITSIGNDFTFDDLFARQVRALVSRGDMVIAFTTSGRSRNVVNGLAAAREQGATTVLFGGSDGGPAAGHADFPLLVPSTSTARVQEMHLLLLHLVIEQVDEWAAAGRP
jgi:D-sedoheptulose 7-phosphate isomerase